MPYSKQPTNKCRPTTVPLPPLRRRTQMDTPLPLLCRRHAPTETVTPLHPLRRRCAPMEDFAFLLANKQLTNNENPLFPGLQQRTQNIAFECGTNGGKSVCNGEFSIPTLFDLSNARFQRFFLETRKTMERSTH